MRKGKTRRIYEKAYVRSFSRLLRLQHLPQDIHVRIRLDSNPRLHPAFVDVLYQAARRGFRRGRPVRGLGGGHVGVAGFVVEGVEVGARGGEGLNPAVRLLGVRGVRLGEI